MIKVSLQNASCKNLHHFRQAAVRHTKLGDSIHTPPAGEAACLSRTWHILLPPCGCTLLFAVHQTSKHMQLRAWTWMNIFSKFSGIQRSKKSNGHVASLVSTIVFWLRAMLSDIEEASWASTNVDFNTLGCPVLHLKIQKIEDELEHASGVGTSWHPLVLQR